MRGKAFLFEVGEVVLNQKIIEQIYITRKDGSRRKGYKYICQKDGYIGEKLESHLKEGKGCPCCTNTIVQKGINDVATTHPHLIKYFANLEDVYTHSYGSSKKVVIKCPNCREESQVRISSLQNQGHSCSNCSDGISFPEKFVRNLLKELKIDYEYQYSPKWSNNKRYDFYIPSLNCIIETHGEQHYKNNCGKWNSDREIQKNDSLKEEIAKNNGISKYFVLDCRESSLIFIRESICQSNLLDLLKVEKEQIRWNIIQEASIKNLVYEVISLRNEFNYSVEQISDSMKLNKDTIYRYFKIAKELGLIKYDGRQETTKALLAVGEKRQRKIRCIELDVETDSITKMVEYFKSNMNISLTRSCINLVCTKKRKTHKGYTFQYV